LQVCTRTMVKRSLPNSVKVAKAAAAEDALLETRAELPADPEDARLTIDGAVVDANLKLNVAAYEDLLSWYAGEPSPDKHPHPTFPGVRAGEAVPKGMRVWDDLRAGATTKDGAGWIAARSARKGEPKREKWFNMRTTGSWRLAFVLARLQRDIWERRGGPGFNQQAAAAASSTTGSQAPAAVDDGEDELEVKPPTEGDEVITPQKAPRPATTAAASPAAPSGRKRRAPAAVKPQQPPQKKTTIGADALAGSVRLQQILAARKAQEEAAAHAHEAAA